MKKFKYEVYMTNADTNQRLMLCKSRTREGAIKNANAWYNDQVNPKWKPTAEQIEWATKTFNSMEIVEA